MFPNKNNISRSATIVSYPSSASSSSSRQTSSLSQSNLASNVINSNRQRNLRKISEQSHVLPNSPMINSTNNDNYCLVQIVTTCRVCRMISISDKKRILCPYCGSFYDPNFNMNIKRKNVNKNSSILVRETSLFKC